MAFPEYQLRQYLHMDWIRETGQHSKWLYGTRKQVSEELSLEDEISSLKRQLELLVIQRKSLSSPDVVELSMILDVKINEYMNQNKKNR